MFKRVSSILAVLFVIFAMAGCSGNSAKKKTTASSISQSELVVCPGQTYINHIPGQKFYCMRVKDDYYMFEYTGSSAQLLSADDTSLYPALEDGQFALVTADLDKYISDFGYIPVISTLAVKITSLKSSEPVEFEAMARNLIGLPSADSKEINKNSKLFQYTHKEKLYLILVIKGQVTAYTKDGLFLDYELEEGEDQFDKFFKALKVKR